MRSAFASASAMSDLIDVGGHGFLAGLQGRPAAFDAREHRAVGIGQHDTGAGPAAVDADDQRGGIEWSCAHARDSEVVRGASGAGCVNDDNMPVTNVIDRPISTYQGHAIVATPPSVSAVDG